MIIGFQENIQRPLIRTKCQRWRNGWCSENSRVALDFFHLRPVDKIHFVTRYTETHLPSGDGNSCTNKNNFNRNGHEKWWSKIRRIWFMIVKSRIQNFFQSLWKKKPNTARSVKFNELFIATGIKHKILFSWDSKTSKWSEESNDNGNN